jgi:inner membrane transporter RhtA
LPARPVPAPLLFVLGGTSMYLGAALAVLLFEQLEPSGVAWLRMLGAAVVLLAWRRPGAAAWRGRRFLLAGFTVAAVLLAPLAAGTGPAWSSPSLLLLGLGAGVLSTVVPYVLDQTVLRRVGRARFALLLALLPATASVVGMLVLAQVPLPLEALGIVAVVAAVALRSRGPVRSEVPG